MYNAITGVPQGSMPRLLLFLFYISDTLFYLHTVFASGIHFSYFSENANEIT